MKKSIGLIFLIFSVTLVSASYSDCSIYGNCQPLISSNLLFGNTTINNITNNIINNYTINSYYAYFASGAISLASDAYYIGLSAATSDPAENCIYLPESNITEISCYIQTNSGISSFNATDQEGNYYPGASCQTAEGGISCLKQDLNVPVTSGLLTIDFEEVSGNAGGLGSCYVKYILN